MYKEHFDIISNQVAMPSIQRTRKSREILVIYSQEYSVDLSTFFKSDILQIKN